MRFSLAPRFPLRDNRRRPNRLKSTRSKAESRKIVLDKNCLAKGTKFSVLAFLFELAREDEWLIPTGNPDTFPAICPVCAPPVSTGRPIGFGRKEFALRLK